MKLTDIAKLYEHALSPRERIRVWEEFFRKNPQAREKRRRTFEETFGSVEETDGRAMEDALWLGRRIAEETPDALGTSTK